MRKKIKKGLLLLLLSLMIVVVSSDLFVIIRINITEEKVGKSCFSNNYFIESINDKTKIDDFKDFMLIEGWRFSENYKDVIIFRKGNLQKEIQVDNLIKIWYYKIKSKSIKNKTLIDLLLNFLLKIVKKNIRKLYQKYI